MSPPFGRLPPVVRAAIQEAAATLELGQRPPSDDDWRPQPSRPELPGKRFGVFEAPKYGVEVHVHPTTSPIKSAELAMQTYMYELMPPEAQVMAPLATRNRFRDPQNQFLHRVTVNNPSNNTLVEWRFVFYPLLLQVPVANLRSVKGEEYLILGRSQLVMATINGTKDGERWADVKLPNEYPVDLNDPKAMLKPPAWGPPPKFSEWRTMHNHTLHIDDLCSPSGRHELERRGLDRESANYVRRNRSLMAAMTAHFPVATAGNDLVLPMLDSWWARVAPDAVLGRGAVWSNYGQPTLGAPFVNYMFGAMVAFQGITLSQHAWEITEAMLLAEFARLGATGRRPSGLQLKSYVWTMYAQMLSALLDENPQEVADSKALSAQRLELAYFLRAMTQRWSKFPDGPLGNSTAPRLGESISSDSWVLP
jgi:hypothetical protein